MTRSFRTAALALALAACAPPRAPLQIIVLQLDASKDPPRYVLAQATLKTVTDLAKLDGEATRIVGAARIRIDPKELADRSVQTTADFRRIAIKEPGGPVSFRWFMRGGVVHPEDFHSLNMATAYFNFEATRDFFMSAGVAKGDLPDIPLYYFPRLELVQKDGKAVLQTDNALFFPALRAFLVLPFDELQELPLAMNMGVVAHEYTHSVWNLKVMGGADRPWLDDRAADDPARWTRVANLYDALNEGLADVLGAAVAKDPRFVARSISKLEGTRDLDAKHCIAPEIHSDLSLPRADYDPYALGTLVGAAIWQSADDDERVGMAGGVVEAMTKLGELLVDRQSDVDLGLAANAIAQGSPLTTRAKLCGLLRDRLELGTERLPICIAFREPPSGC
jgi:hypothetical protein